ncbi:hypothetical protein B0H11DRAFT_2259919 [Mycena galericulata]|nr:hypothetical protein B0H11DRAFT_2259919 [Mycena galericulata]
MRAPQGYIPQESDLRELFSTFGRVVRVDVGRDYGTGVGKGAVAQKAMEEANGKGYVSLTPSPSTYTLADAAHAAHTPDARRSPPRVPGHLTARCHQGCTRVVAADLAMCGEFRQATRQVVVKVGPTSAAHISTTPPPNRSIFNQFPQIWTRAGLQNAIDSSAVRPGPTLVPGISNGETIVELPTVTARPLLLIPHSPRL